jgi:hypothetical protein
MQDPLALPGGLEPGGPDPLRLTRALTHDLRASLHGLSLTLEMLRSALPETAPGPADHYLGMARAEAAQLDRTVEQLGLWIRVLGGDYRVRPQRLDLRQALAERLPEWARLPDAPVMVLADRQLLHPALDGLGDFLRAYAHGPEAGGVDLLPGGQMRVFGPHALLPVLQTVVADAVPDLQAAKGPAVWLVGPALAVGACRSCAGSVRLEQQSTGCALWLNWPLG